MIILQTIYTLILLIIFQALYITLFRVFRVLYEIFKKEYKYLVILEVYDVDIYGV